MDGQKFLCLTMDHAILLRSFTTLMKDYNVNHLTSSPHYPQSNGLAEKYMQIVKNVFYKAKEEDKDLFKCLMVYCNIPLSESLSSPMQILTSRSARSSSPMSHGARRQKGLDCENLRTHCKNEHLPMHDIHLHQAVMYQDPASKRWYPATITKLCQEPRSYIVTTKQGVQHRMTQAHLKSYKPQEDTNENELLVQNTHKQAVTSAKYKQNNANLAQSRARRDIKHPKRLDS